MPPRRWIHKVSQQRAVAASRSHSVGLGAFVRSTSSSTTPGTCCGRQSSATERAAPASKRAGSLEQTSQQIDVGGGTGIPYTRGMVRAALNLRRMHHFRVQTQHKTNFVDPVLQGIKDTSALASKHLHTIQSGLGSLQRAQDEIMIHHGRL